LITDQQETEQTIPGKILTCVFGLFAVKKTESEIVNALVPILSERNPGSKQTIEDNVRQAYQQFAQSN